MPENYNSELKKFSKGLKRLLSARQQEDGESLVEGKMSFQFSFFHKLCKTMRGQTKKKYIFAHTFLVISWNLMCRAGNSVSIRYEHLEWDEDSLAIWSGHMKNDQEGDRQRASAHIRKPDGA
ncbi:Integrase-like, catalytic domain [Phytophthora cactorum]|nr:Integrase-like, catalytic domain [Phytophthora cactorum]